MKCGVARWIYRRFDRTEKCSLCECRGCHTGLVVHMTGDSRGGGGGEREGSRSLNRGLEMAGGIGSVSNHEQCILKC